MKNWQPLKLLALVLCLGFSFSSFAGWAQKTRFDKNSDLDKPVYDSTILLKIPQSPLATDEYTRNVRMIYNGAVKSKKKYEERAEKRPLFKKNVQDLKLLNAEIEAHNLKADEQTAEVDRLLKAGGNTTGEYTRAYGKWVFIQNQKKKLEAKKLALKQKIFGPDYSKWKDASDYEKLLELELRVLGDFKNASTANCSHHITPEGFRQCNTCLWNGAPCPEPLPNVNYQGKIDWIMKNKEKVTTGELNYDDVP